MKALPQNLWVRRRAIPRDCGREIRVYEYVYEYEYDVPILISEVDPRNWTTKAAWSLSGLHVRTAISPSNSVLVHLLVHANLFHPHLMRAGTIIDV